MLSLFSVSGNQTTVPHDGPFMPAERKVVNKDDVKEVSIGAGGKLKGAAKAVSLIPRKGDSRFVNGVHLPPPIQTSLYFTHKVRFLVTSATATNVLVRGLLASAGVVCYTANAAARTLFSSVRVKRVQLWTEPNAASNDNSSLVWTPTNHNIPDVEFVDANMGTAMIGYQEHKPPKNSPAAFWWNTVDEGLSLFSVSCPVNSYMDVTMELCSSNNENGSAIAIATGIAGNIYYLACDMPTTHRLSPVGLPTTF
jgi:hypothetical protein